jgi:hypothetical protein
VDDLLSEFDLTAAGFLDVPLLVGALVAVVATGSWLGVPADLLGWFTGAG